jgi:hypothetical protein
MYTLIMSSIKKQIYNFQYLAFNTFILSSYILIFLATLGLSSNAIQYLNVMDYYIRIYICLFLIYRFNPFRKIEFNDLDRQIAFSSGLFLLTTSALNNYIIYIKKYMVKIIENIKGRIYKKSIYMLN